MKKAVIIMVIMIMGIISVAFSKVDLRSKEYDIGFSGCFWLGGDISIGSMTWEKDASFMFRGFYDAYLMEKLSMGLYLNLEPVSEDGGDVFFYDMGFSIKPRFFINEDLVMKPGINIGYRGGSSDHPFWEDPQGMAINVSLEFVKALESISFLIDTGFLTQPIGGSGTGFDVQWAPIVYIGGGFVF